MDLSHSKAQDDHAPDLKPLQVLLHLKKSDSDGEWSPISDEKRIRNRKRRRPYEEGQKEKEKEVEDTQPRNLPTISRPHKQVAKRKNKGVQPQAAPSLFSLMASIGVESVDCSLRRSRKPDIKKGT